MKKYNTVEEIQKRLKLLNKRCSKVLIEIRDLDNKLIEICSHEHTEEKSTYYEGGYDYTSRTEHKLVCKTCNKYLKTWTTNHGSYA